MALIAMMLVEMEAYIGEDWPRRLKRIGHSCDSYTWGWTLRSSGADVWNDGKAESPSDEP